MENGTYKTIKQILFFQENIKRYQKYDNLS